MDKPRVRIPAGSTGKALVRDSFQNFAARTGIGTENLASAGGYGFNPISRNRQELEWMYRGSWIVRQAVDAVAEDMTRAGVDIQSEMEPDDVDVLQKSLEDLGVWQALNDTIKWARLYGGCIAVMLIDGQKPDKPLRLQAVGKGQFKGMLVLDRWMIQPSLDDVVTDLGPDYLQPKFYSVVADAKGLPRMRIHHSRIVRLEGDELPYYQRVAENGWGLSVIEPLYDRLLAFDSTTQGAAQLVFKAHLRTYSVKGLRELIAKGGKMYEALLEQMKMVRLYQSNEGMTLLDTEDTFEAHQYSFSGLSDLILQFAQQLSGALKIPLVRLFGQSPAGLNSTGESDWQNYDTGIHSQQERRLRGPVGRILAVAHQSLFGSSLPDDFGFTFRPLRQMSEGDKAEIVSKITAAVAEAFEAGVIDAPTAMRELKAIGHLTGVYTNITDEQIEEAENAPPPASEMVGHNGGPALEGGDERADARDEAPDFEEAKHPRASNGEFASSAGGGAS